MRALPQGTPTEIKHGGCVPDDEEIENKLCRCKSGNIERGIVMVDAAKAKEEFLTICHARIHRDGFDEFMEWLQTTDFFEAPASSKYHLNVPGGLCQHSINVYKRLYKFLYNEYGGDCNGYSKETIALVSLFHDLCKTNFYKIGWKNQKTYDPETVQNALPRERKRDAAGDFIWETVPCYTVEEDFIYGHGEKSVFLLMQYIMLSPEEAQAIRFHMGSWNSEEARNAGDCWGKNPLAFFLHFADEAATFIDEVEA